MLTIEYAREDKRPNQVEWHVGEPIPVKPEKVNSVYADYNELDYIRLHFVNIPDYYNKRGITWLGDIAKFIVANLKF